MPGGSARLTLVLFLYQLTGLAAEEARKELVSTVDGSVTFPVTHSVNGIESIVWNFNSTTLVTIQPTTTDRKDNVIVTQSHNKDRVGFPPGNYSLELSKLTKSDSGTYRVQMYNPALPQPLTHEYRLRVYGRLAKPKVTMGPQDRRNGTCVANLTCTVEQGGEGVTYRWEARGPMANGSHDGPVLPVSWRLGGGAATFVCMARNPVSSNASSPVSALKLCSGAVGASVSTVFLVLSGLSLLLCILVLGAVLLTIRRETRGGSPEQKKVAAHQEVHDYTTASGVATLYASIPDLKRTLPEENAANTLYFTVQIPEKM